MICKVIGHLICFLTESELMMPVPLSCLRILFFYKRETSTLYTTSGLETGKHPTFSFYQT